jgi:hypothetical protein
VLSNVDPKKTKTTANNAPKKSVVLPLKRLWFQSDIITLSVSKIQDIAMET